MPNFRNLKKLSPRNFLNNVYCRFNAAQEARQKARWEKMEMLDSLRYETLARELEIANFTSIAKPQTAINIWDTFCLKPFLPRLSFNLGFIVLAALGLAGAPAKAGAARLAEVLQLITAPNPKLIEFNVSADYQPKTKTVQENLIETSSKLWYNKFNKDKLIISGGTSISLPLEVSFRIENEIEKEKGTIEIRGPPNIADYENTKNNFLIKIKKILETKNLNSSLGLGFRLENETEKKDNFYMEYIDNQNKKNNQLVFLGEMSYNSLPVKLFFKGDYGMSLSGSEILRREDKLFVGEEVFKEEYSQKGSELELTLGGKLPIKKTNIGLAYTLHSDKKELTGTFTTRGPPPYYSSEGQYTNNKQLIQFFTEFAFGLVLKAGYSMEDFTKKGGIVEIKTTEGGKGANFGAEYRFGFGK